MPFRIHPGWTLAVLLLCSSSAIAAPPAFACIGGTQTIKANPAAGCPSGTQAALSGVSFDGTTSLTISGTGTGEGKANFTSIVITKGRDAATDVLLSDLSGKTLIGTIAIGVYLSGNTGASVTPDYNLLLSNVYVTNWSWSVAAGNSSALVESVTLTFQKLVLVDNNTKQTVTWDPVKNTVN
ncbi:MAG: type VI secretion system tube protein Hcp [Terracidiphilus sp.]